jgi:phage tail sheath gpL-like
VHASALPQIFTASVSKSQLPKRKLTGSGVLGRPKKNVFTNSVITAKILDHSTKIDAVRPVNDTKIK